MNSSSPNKDAGFTLIEIMIVVAILAFISLGIFQATTSSFKIRDELLQESDFYTAIRLAMGMINRDVTSVYSPVVLLTPKANPSGTPSGTSSGGSGTFDETQISASTAADLARSSAFWQAAVEKNGLRPSRFVGTESKMSFIANTNFRVYKDSPESEFAKIVYSIEEDNSSPINGFKVEGSSRLVKETSANAFDIDDSKDRESMRKYTLLRGITSCRFSYYRWEDNSFKKFTSWDSDKEDFKSKIPDVIQIDLEVKGQAGLSYTGYYRFKPELPFNGLNPSF